MPGQPRIEATRASRATRGVGPAPANSIIPSKRTIRFAIRPASVCVGADVSSAQAERSSAASSSRARGRHDSGIVSTGKDSIGLSTTSAGPPRPFNPCHSESLAGALARAEACPERSRRVYLLSMHPAATQKSEHHPSPVQGRNNDSPARNCRVSHGSRPRALRAPLFNLDQPDVITTMTAPLATRAGHPLDSPSHLKHNASYFPARTYRSFLCRASIVR